MLFWYYPKRWAKTANCSWNPLPSSYLVDHKGLNEGVCRVIGS